MTMEARPGSQGGGVSYMSRLSLRREPFAPLNDEDFFYPEAQRAKCLKFLLHLTPYSDVLLLTGGPASGKTCLIQQLIVQSSPSWRICQIEADIATDVNTVLQKMADVFLFDTSPELSLEQRISNMHKMLKAQRNSALAPVVIIDDAHLVGLPILHFLASLLDYDDQEDRLMCLILVGRDELKERLASPSLELLNTRVSHAFELLPFSEEDTRGYIQHRLAVAGGREEAVFTSAVFRAIHEESGGVPGKINVCAMAALRDSAGSAAPVQQPLTSVMEKLTLPWRKIGIGVAVVVFGIILLMQDKINQSIESEVKDEGIVSAADQSQTLDLSKVTRFPWEDPPPGSVTEQPVVEQVPAVAEEIVAGSGERDSKPEDQAEGATMTAAIEIAEAPGPAPIPQTDSGQNESAEVTPVPGAPAKVEEVAVAEQAPPAPVPAAETAEQAAQASSGRREGWILARDPQHFTVQLMAMDEPKVTRLVREWGIAHEVAYYATDRGLLAVLYGDFISRKESSAAADELMKKIRARGIKPWIRPFSAVQAKIQVSPASTAQGKAEPVVSGEMQRLRTDEDRLLTRNPQHYTLQLMAMDLDAVNTRVKKWKLGSQMVYFRTLKRDKELIAVTYGDYATRQDALRGSQQLTAKIRGITPWIRQFGSIHDSITEFRAVSR